MYCGLMETRPSSPRVTLTRAAESPALVAVTRPTLPSPQRAWAWRTISSTGASAAGWPVALPGWMKALSWEVISCFCAGVLYTACSPNGMYNAISVIRPV
ncbi:hypothetical protein D3C87_1727450 [compost metagenome]